MSRHVITKFPPEVWPIVRDRLARMQHYIDKFRHYNAIAEADRMVDAEQARAAQSVRNALGPPPRERG